MGHLTHWRAFARCRAAKRRGRRSDERGVVIVWLAVPLPFLLGVAALGIDVAFWQVTKNREQRAADAAALAGAVSFPGNGDAANAAAVNLAQSNGYPVGSIIPVAADGTCTMPTGAD